MAGRRLFDRRTSRDSKSLQGIKIVGVKEFAEQIKRLGNDLATADAREVIDDALQLGERALIGSAASANVPRRVLNDIFSYNKPKPGAEKGKVSGLLGVRKAGRNRNAKGYVTWFPSTQRGKFTKKIRSRRKGQLVEKGRRAKDGSLQKIGENLGTMWELGTSKMKARPWFRPAIIGTSDNMLDAIMKGFGKILDKYTK